MTDKIEPALTDEEWAAAQTNEFERQRLLIEACRPISGNDHRRIALTNAALPDSDPRKITRELVTRLREEAYNAADGWSGPRWLADLADALESYLPPESA